MSEITLADIAAKLEQTDTVIVPGFRLKEWCRDYDSGVPFETHLLQFLGKLEELGIEMRELTGTSITFRRARLRA